MCKHEATLQDAVVAVVLVETSMHTSAMLGVDSVLHSSFPDVRTPAGDARAREVPQQWR